MDVQSLEHWVTMLTCVLKTSLQSIAICGKVALIPINNSQLSSSNGVENVPIISANYYCQRMKVININKRAF